MLSVNGNESFIVSIQGRQNRTYLGTVTQLSTGSTKTFQSTMELLLTIDDALREENDDVRTFR